MTASKISLYHEILINNVDCGPCIYEMQILFCYNVTPQDSCHLHGYVIISMHRRLSLRKERGFSSLPGVDIHALRVTSQASYSPEYITPIQKKTHDY